MKINKKVILVSVLFLICLDYSFLKQHKEISSPPINKMHIKWESMYSAICSIESEFDQFAYNSRTEAAGIIQLRPIYVKDVNRIIGYKKYTLKDRYNISKCREMFEIYQKYYNPKKDIHTAILLHYNGPNISGVNKWYLNKVLNKMN